jgi:hypothetical protein
MCKCTLSQKSYEQQLNPKPAPESETTMVADNNVRSSPTVYSTAWSDDSPQSPSMMITLGHDISGIFDFNSFDSVCSTGVHDLSFQSCNNPSLWNTTTLLCSFNTSAISETVEGSQLDLLPSPIAWSQTILDNATNSWFGA